MALNSILAALFSYIGLGYFLQSFPMLPDPSLCPAGGQIWCPCNVGDLGWIPGLGRSPREGKGYPLQYFGLENSMDYIVHGVAKSWTG